MFSLQNAIQDLTNKENKLKDLKKLYSMNKVDIGQQVDTYTNPQFCRKVLSTTYQWTEEDNAKLLPIFSGHRRDARSHKNYAFTLLTGWLAEDIVLINLNKHGKIFNKNGCDDKRDLLEDRKINNAPDIVSVDSDIYIEVVTNYHMGKEKCFWEENKQIDLRDNKLDHLMSYSENATVFLVGLMVAKSKYYLLPIDKNTKYSINESNAFFGGKKTKAIELNQAMMQHRLADISTIFRRKI